MKFLKKFTKNKFCKNIKNTQDKSKKQPKSLRFFEDIIPNKLDNKINININEEYFGKYFKNKYQIENKIQLLKIKNYPLNNFKMVSQEFENKQIDLILNLETICSLNFFFRYCFKNNFDLNQIFIKNNLSIFENFSNLTIMKKIEVILLLDCYGFKSESLIDNLIQDLEKSILEKNFEKEILFYYDFFTILHFFASILTRDIKKINYQKIENILNPEFLNGIFLKIIQKSDIRQNELFLNFISEKLQSEDRNYLFDQLLKNIFFKMLDKKI